MCPESHNLVCLNEVVKQVQDKWTDRTKWNFDRYIAGEHINSGEIRINNYGLIKGNEDKIGSAFHMKFYRGDVLYVTRRAYLRKAGIVNFEGICSNVTLVLRTIESKLIQSLLPFILQSEEFTSFAIENSIGSTNPFVKWSDIGKYKLIIPSIPEQKKISEILWAIEENIEKTEKLLETIEKLKKGLLSQLLTKGIGHTKFKETEIGQIPKDWKIVKFGEIADIIKGVSYSSEDLSDDQGHILINLKCFNKGGGFNSKGIKYFNGKYKENQMLFENDLVIANTDITRNAEVVGYPAVIPKLESDKKAIYTMDVSKINIFNSTVLSKYLYYFFLTDYSHDSMIKNSSGTTVLHLNVNSIKTIEIPLPKIEEQGKIISLLGSFDMAIKTYKSHITHLSNLKMKLTNEFLSGNIRIPPEVLKNVQ